MKLGLKWLFEIDVYQILNEKKGRVEGKGVRKGGRGGGLNRIDGKV